MTVHPRSLIGAGGEAEIFDMGNGEVLKLFKGPDHPDLSGSPQDQQAAKRRLELHQEKLPAFPLGLPKQVITPVDLARSKDRSSIVGYLMPRVHDPVPLLRLAHPKFRRSGLSNKQVLPLFQELWDLLLALHKQGVVVGDFNDANVLISQGHPWLIDADSFQFGKFPCSVFTERFVDPLLSPPGTTGPTLGRPYTWEADWYAFNAMLFQSLLLVTPWGGVFRPPKPSQRIPQAARSLRRISLYDPRVHRPKAAHSPDILPDEWNQHFQDVFERDHRGIFPRALLETLEFQTCKSCQSEHARTCCPNCKAVGAGSRTLQLKIRGELRAESAFDTKGVILTAAFHLGKLGVVHHHAGAYRREDNQILFESPLDPALRFLVCGENTLVIRERELVVLGKRSKAHSRSLVDRMSQGACVACNDKNWFWIRGGTLLRDAPRCPTKENSVGEVLPNATHLWVGPRFGFGFYQVGRLPVAFVFGTTTPGIHDGVPFPRLPGKLLDVECVLDSQRAWLVLTVQKKHRRIHLLRLYSRQGELELDWEIPPEHPALPGLMGGKLATDGLLLASSDRGLDRLERMGNTLAVTQSFSDAESFVDSVSSLLAGPQGLLVVGKQTITALHMGGPRSKGATA
jgi:hypothetical protein